MAILKATRTSTALTGVAVDFRPPARLTFGRIVRCTGSDRPAALSPDQEMT